MIEVKVEDDFLNYHAESRKNFSEFQAFHQAVSKSVEFIGFKVTLKFKTL